MSANVHYRKKCRVCGKDFESASRNTALCGSPKCLEKAKKINNRLKRRRRAYHRDSENLRLQAMARAESRKKKIESMEKPVCEHCGIEHSDFSKLDVHHVDCDPFNMSPENLRILCNSSTENKCHELEQSEINKKIKENLEMLRKRVKDDKALLAKAESDPAVALKIV